MSMNVLLIQTNVVKVVPIKMEDTIAPVWMALGLTTTVTRAMVSFYFFYFQKCKRSKQIPPPLTSHDKPLALSPTSSP